MHWEDPSVNVAVFIILSTALFMKIKNINGLTATDLQQQVNNGGRFVYFSYTISLVVVTFRDTSGVYLIRSGETTTGKSFVFTIVSLLAGWWGIPWGPKFTMQAIRNNLRGGKDVTDEVMGVVNGYLLFEETYGKQPNNPF